MKYKESENQSFESESDIRTSAAWNYFWFGFLLYALGFSFPGYNISIKYLQAIQIVGIVLLVFSGFYLIRWSFENLYLKVLFLIYILWSVVTIFRGFTFNYNVIKILIFFAPFSILIYFVPLILIFRGSLTYIKKIFSVIIILNLNFLIYVFIYRDLLIHGDSRDPYKAIVFIGVLVQFLSLPSAYILLTYFYHKKRIVFFSLFILILTFIFATIMARRGLMFMTLCFLVSSYLIFYFLNSGTILKVLISIILFVLVIFFAYITYSKNQSGSFSLISSRIHEDTRTGVEVAFYNDLSTLDWIIGKGIDGKYYAPNISLDYGKFVLYRREIETGYLQIILKGGLISLVLYLLITIPAIFIGLFSSKNILAKASAIWIFLHTLFLYPSYVNMFSFSYLMIWISVGICYSKTIREKSDEEIKDILKYNSK